MDTKMVDFVKQEAVRNLTEHDTGSIIQTGKVKVSLYGILYNFMKSRMIEGTRL